MCYKKLHQKIMELRFGFALYQRDRVERRCWPPVGGCMIDEGIMVVEVSPPDIMIFCGAMMLAWSAIDSELV